MANTTVTQAAALATSLAGARDFVNATVCLSYPTLSFLSKAKLLTEFLTRSTALPDVLQRHGALLLAFTTGAAAATGVYHYFQRFRKDRTKVQLGVYHIVRQLENLPDFYERLNNPHNLIKDIDTEVSLMIDKHLTKHEAADVFMQVKRKIWVCIDERRGYIKKQRTDAGVSNEPIRRTLQAVTGDPIGVFSHPTRVVEKLPQEEEKQDVDMEDVENVSVAPQDTRSSSSPLPPPPPGTCRSTYKFPSSSSPKPAHQLTPAPWHVTSPPSSGYGLNYDDENQYIPEASPTEQKAQRTQPIATKEPTMLQRATQRAFDLNALGNNPHATPVLPFSRALESTRTIETSVTKPSNTLKNQQPPNTMVVISGNPKKGTWLVSVPEGASPQHSPASGTTEYRVTERRTFYHDLEKNRQIRRTIRNVFIHNEEENIAEAVEKKEEVESSSPLPLPPKEVKTPEVSSPAFPSTPEWPSSGVNFSPFACDPAPAVVRVVTESGASSPAARKRGRPRKQSVEPQTPGKAHTLAGVRTSARKNKFSGKYIGK
ncbi:hypothetical protein EK21DRAFT_86323 [Setomelanomma holmii]|uniref:Uncharacterized protein n=1 Tax=Setomelanomma holmii TaxID=210430 RepID=A0A9P4HFB1_9PLEO|nr:hypothetical protein EK21DRAFT_86323 [Setomelanomma holmii]